MKRLFTSLPDTAHLADVFKAFPATVRPLMEFHDILMRGESDLSVAERELIAAYVSGLNACSFCFGAHKLMARAFGVDEALMDALVADIDTAPVEAKLRPLLAYVAKLTRSPSMLIEADAQAVYDAGWSESALYDAIQTCALYNLMNRIVEGTGVAPYPEIPENRIEDELSARRTRTYMDFGRSIGAID
ncbi:carboxymuconolactone decarboxylase family protein [Aestuariivita boseongensis]|uniref:carboxymuconolactone decarboxylase family protein n=1 Tax=Aestuariivita boseongensis TaxID=1470562 RepID=UPI0006803AB4|nr:peroxidase-related enzyme [Aestuariivita boseongensis]